MSQDDLRVKGFLAAAVKSGIRGKKRLDLGLIYSEKPAAAAAVFTTNRVKAAPVLLGMERISSGYAQAILVNSGIANACTGDQGMEAARKCSGLVSRALSIPDDLVLVSSTGVIGQQLDLACFEGAMDRLTAGLDPEGIPRVARAMMTTDTVQKTAVRDIVLDGKKVRLAGIAKGAGMIMPNMATMLCYVLTDAKISPRLLQEMLGKGVDHSFNSITVDGDTSTNDTVFVLANSAAGNTAVDDLEEGADIFEKALNEVLRELALKIVADGEGATKEITIKIAGAADLAQAKAAAMTVANSNLVKTAFFGEDANWGRIIAALGRSGAEFDPQAVDISFDDVVLVRDGLGLGAEAEQRAASILRKKKIVLGIDLKAGHSGFEAFTCDFSVDYVKINADYRT